MAQLRVLLLLALAAAFSSGCSDDRRAVHPQVTPAFLDTPVPTRTAATAQTRAKGRELYQANCAHCHGDDGRGNGYGAPFLVPSPRDFTTAQYKFRTTASGSLPSDEDLFGKDVIGLVG